MYHWNTLEYPPKECDSTSYIYTPPRYSEQTARRVKSYSPDETLLFIKSLPHSRFALEELVSRYPILGDQTRFTHCDSPPGHISNLDITLLLAAGYYHREIADYLHTTRLTVTRIAMKLEAAIGPIRNSQRPYQASATVSEKPEGEGVINVIAALIEECGDEPELQPNHLSDQIQILLDDDFKRFTRRYERKTISLGVGKAAEEILDELLHSDTDSGKVTQKRVSNRHKGRFDADRILLNYWRGN